MGSLLERQLPTGTVTFVFTDIEGSTRLLAELGNVDAGLAEGRLMDDSAVITYAHA
ncbi:MAG: hypothetical protein ACRDG7_15875 [Candidatus Limnocylindria bacterium]